MPHPQAPKTSLEDLVLDYQQTQQNLLDQFVDSVRLTLGSGLALSASLSQNGLRVSASTRPPPSRKLLPAQPDSELEHADTESRCFIEKSAVTNTKLDWASIRSGKSVGTEVVDAIESPQGQATIGLTGKIKRAITEALVSEGLSSPQADTQQPTRLMKHLDTAALSVGVFQLRGEYQGMHGAGDMAGKTRFSFLTPLMRMVRSPQFDMVMGLVILLNFVALIVEIEVRGNCLADELGFTADRPGTSWASMEGKFKITEGAFTVLYMVELLLRLWAHSLSYWKDAIHLLDAASVVTAALDFMVFAADRRVFVLTFARMVRFLRVFRIIKVIRFMTVFRELRILIRTLRSSMGSLFWSVLLLSIVISGGGIVAFDLSVDFIQDEDKNSPELREFFFKLFGSATRASFSMFEATFTGTWVAKARPMIEHISPWTGVFWVLYIVGINFALMRVIAALFLKTTMAVSSMDDERMSIERLKQRNKFAKVLETFFTLADTSGDGAISHEEFKAILKHPEVPKLFEELDVDLGELIMLFDVCCDDDGVADYHEFLSGAMKLKTSARCIDTIQILHETSVIKKALKELMRGRHAGYTNVFGRRHATGTAIAATHGDLYGIESISSA